MAETSTKPYLIRAIHEWCSDNGFTPYIAVAVDARTRVPREFVRNGEIVLNVSMMATHRLKLGNDFIEFQARFGGTPRELSIPVENVSAIYARENGHGMAFEVPKAAAVTEADAPEDSPAGEVEEESRSTEDPRPAARSRGPTLVPAAPADDDAADGSAAGATSADDSPSASASSPTSADGTATSDGSATPAAPERGARGGRPLRSAGGRNDDRTGGSGRTESGGRTEATGKAESAGKPPGSQRTPRGKQGLAVVPDNSDPKPPPAAPASTSRGDDEPPDPNDNPPRQSPPRLTRIK